MYIFNFVHILPDESLASYVDRLKDINGFDLDTFTTYTFGEKASYLQLEAGLCNIERFCKCLPIVMDPEKLRTEHTYYNLLMNFYNGSNCSPDHFIEVYCHKNKHMGHCPKCRQCIEEDIKAGIPVHTHLDHCLPGVRRCAKHNSPIFISKSTTSTEIYSMYNYYPIHNRAYTNYVISLNGKLPFANLNCIRDGLETASKMICAEGNYLRKAIIDKSYTDHNQWEQWCVHYIEYDTNFWRMTDVVELLSAMLFFFSDAAETLKYFSSHTNTPENKVALYLRLLTGNHYRLSNIKAVTDNNDILFEAYHDACSNNTVYSLKEFMFGKRCKCSVCCTYGPDFLEQIGNKYGINPEIFETGNSDIFLVKHHNYALESINETSMFRTIGEKSSEKHEITRELIFQEATRPTLSPLLPVLYEEKEKKTIKERMKIVKQRCYEQLNSLPPGTVINIQDIKTWDCYTDDIDANFINDIDEYVPLLIQEARYNNIIRRFPEDSSMVVRIESEEQWIKSRRDDPNFNPEELIDAYLHGELSFKQALCRMT